MPKVVPLPKRSRSAKTAVELDLDAAWSLYDKQAQFVKNKSLFSIFLGGVGSGKSRHNVSDPAPRAFQYLLDYMGGKTEAKSLEIWHEGRCGRCGRKLTVPSSIESGIGPECASKLG